MKNFKQSIYRVITALAMCSLVFGWVINVSLLKTSAAKPLFDGKYKNIKVEAKVFDESEISAEELRKTIEESLEEQGIEVTSEDEGEVTSKLFVSLEKADGDLDNDGVPNSKDPDSDGNGIEDAVEDAKAATKGVLIKGAELPEDEEDGDDDEKPTPTPTPFFLPASYRIKVKKTADVRVFLQAIDGDSNVINARNQAINGALRAENLRTQFEKLSNQVNIKSRFQLKGVSIFTGGNQSGISGVFGIGIFSANNGPMNGIPNDSAASIIVPAGFRVKLCSDEGENRQGAGVCEEYGQGEFNLQGTAYKVSWVRVFKWQQGEEVSVTVFEGENYTGKSAEFGIGTFRADNGSINGLGNDTASSVRVPKGFRIKLCEHEGSNNEGAGNCEEYGEGSFNLKYPRTASWVRVWQP